jgi:hypothetical protein
MNNPNREIRINSEELKPGVVVRPVILSTGGMETPFQKQNTDKAGGMVRCRAPV